MNHLITKKIIDKIIPNATKAIPGRNTNIPQPKLKSRFGVSLSNTYLVRIYNKPPPKIQSNSVAKGKKIEINITSSMGIIHKTIGFKLLGKRHIVETIAFTIVLIIRLIMLAQTC